MILRHKPELLGEMIAEIPDNVIPMNYYLNEIRIGDDCLEMEIDYIWNIFGISYSGNKRVMKQFDKISKDWYLFATMSSGEFKNRHYQRITLS